MKTIAIANQKGGTGKSATTHALGAVLAAVYDRRVLMVDIDPQSSLTEASATIDASGASLAEVLGGATPGDAANAGYFAGAGRESLSGSGRSGPGGHGAGPVVAHGARECAQEGAGAHGRVLSMWP